MKDSQRTTEEGRDGIVDRVMGRVRSRKMPLRRLGAVLAIGAMGTGLGVGKATQQTSTPRTFAKDGVAVSAMLPSAASAEASWDLPNLDHDRVDFWVEKFTGDKRGDFTRFMERSGRYIPMSSQKLEERGMPQDLIYLAMIESGFNPEAYSPAAGSEYSVLPAQNATGNWVKITQRVPVRLELTGDAHGVPLRAGMSAYVSIETGRQRGLPFGG